VSAIRASPWGGRQAHRAAAASVDRRRAHAGPVCSTSSHRVGDGRGHFAVENSFYALCLHGHVHEIRAALLRNLRLDPVLVAGLGTFGAPAARRPESTPRSCSLIEVARDLRAARVHMRRMLRDGDPW